MSWKKYTKYAQVGHDPMPQAGWEAQHLTSVLVSQGLQGKNKEGSHA